MFIVIAYGRPDYGSMIKTILGIVYNESDFNRYLDKEFPGVRSESKRTAGFGYDGPLSISYEFYPDVPHPEFDRISMQKINEIGQPNY